MKCMLLSSNSTSVRLLLAFANQFDLMAFDVKTAFLHACLPYDLYVKQVPGYLEADTSTILHLLVALYGFK